jgi:quinol monooxygenase YgiN
MDQKIYMFAKFHAKPGKREEVNQRLQEMVVLTNKEPGCVFYHLHVDREVPEIFYFMECWADQQALDFHMKTPYVQAILRDSESLTIDGIDISFMNRLDI